MTVPPYTWSCWNPNRYDYYFAAGVQQRAYRQLPQGWYLEREPTFWQRVAGWLW